MLRTHTCGALNETHLGIEVVLSGWVHKLRDKGFIIWVDLRDRYGITQLVFDEARTPKFVFEQAQKLGREFVIQIHGIVIERESKNPDLPTGAIEILVQKLHLLNAAKTLLLPLKQTLTRAKNSVWNTVIWISVALLYAKT